LTDALLLTGGDEGKMATVAGDFQALLAALPVKYRREPLETIAPRSR